MNKDIKENKEPIKRSLISQQSVEIEKTEEDSSTKEVGPVRTQSKIIGDAKRMFEKPRRQESIEREKQERIILLNKVSDVKNKFERRASVNAASSQIWNKPIGERKKSITDNNEQQQTLNKTTVAPTTTVSANNTSKSTTFDNTAVDQLAPQTIKEVPKVSSLVSSSSSVKDEIIKPDIKPITTSISTIKPKLVERQVSVSSSANNPPTGNDRSF